MRPEAADAGSRLARTARVLIFPVFACLSVAACASSGGPDLASEVPEVQQGRFPLLPGDAIQLSFSREPGLNGTYLIDESGHASLPLIGGVELADRPATTVKSDLEREYARLTRNQTIQVVTLRRVRVVGEVRNPGIYHVDPTMTFDDAIAMAGGGLTDANLENVSLVRNGERVASGVDARWTVGGTLQSGDQIFVPRNGWFYRNAGLLIGATISALGVVLAFSR